MATSLIIISRSGSDKRVGGPGEDDSRGIARRPWSGWPRGFCLPARSEASDSSRLAMKSASHRLRWCTSRPSQAQHNCRGFLSHSSCLLLERPFSRFCASWRKLQFNAEKIVGKKRQQSNPSSTLESLRSMRLMCRPVRTNVKQP